MYVPGSYVVSAAAAKSGLSCDCIECMGLEVCDPMRRGFGDGCRIPAVGSGCGCCCVLLLIADEVGAVRGAVAGAGVVDFLCVFCEEEAVVVGVKECGGVRAPHTGLLAASFLPATIAGLFCCTRGDTVDAVVADVPVPVAMGPGAKKSNLVSMIWRSRSEKKKSEMSRG